MRVKLIIAWFIGFLFLSMESVSQVIEGYDTVTITTGDLYVLNSVNATNFSNGKNRNAMVYPIPQNAKYVILSVLVDNSDFVIDKKNYQSLMSKFTNITSNQYLFFTGSMTLEAFAPSGTGRVCDFFIPSSMEEKKKFMSTGYPWKYKVASIAYVDKYTRLNTQSFAIRIDVADINDKNELCLAFQNHSLRNQCKIVVDIIAFVGKH